MSVAVLEGAAYDSALQVWCIDDPRLGEVMLAHPSLRPPPYAELYGALAERFGIDFSGMIFAFTHIPLCLHGSQHAAARRAMAGFVAGRRPAILPELPALAVRHLAPLRREGDCDLLGAVIEPLIFDLLARIVDLDGVDLASGVTTSRIFSRGAGLTKRRRMETEISALIGQIRAALGPDAGEDEVGRRLSLLILGRDALTGTIGTSLARFFAAGAGLPLSAVPLPSTPTDTGVPYIERVATEAVEIAGRRWAEGDRFRIMLSAFTQTPDERERVKIFGVGSHTCLGRPLSLDLWQAIGRELASIGSRVEIVDYALREDDVFAIPARFLVRIEV